MPMNRLLKYLLGGLLLLGVACSSVGKSPTDHFTEPIYQPTWAEGFELLATPEGESTLLRVKSPWQGEVEHPFELLLLRGDEEAPRGFRGQVLPHEPQRIVCFSSSHVALLDALGESDRIVGVSGLRFIHNEKIQQRKEHLREVGYDGNVDFEALLALECDLVLLYGVNGSCSMEPKLRELKIPFLYVGEYLEENPLGKSEWMVPLGELLNCRERAEASFGEIPERYNALKERVLQAQKPAPKVMINTPYADSWFMPSTKSYIARLIADAGGEYLYRANQTSRSLPIDLEEAALLSLEADIWINAGSALTLEEFKRELPKFAEIPCVRRGAVCNCNGRLNPSGGNDFWESGAVRPDLVLRDLVKLFHPELVEEPLYYYRILE